MRAYGYRHSSRPFGHGYYRPQEHVPMFPPPPAPPEVWDFPLGQQIVLLTLYGRMHRSELADIVIAKLGGEKPVSADWSAQIKANHVVTFGGWKLTPSGDRAALDLLRHHGRKFNIHHVYYRFNHRGFAQSVHCACDGLHFTPRRTKFGDSQMENAVANHFQAIEEGRFTTADDRAARINAIIENAFGGARQ